MRIVVDKNLRVATRDGVELATDIYRAEGSERHPSVVIRTPYSKDVPGLVNGWMNIIRAAESGWAVVVQDVRGRFRSDGTFEPFVHEGPDGADLVEWIVDQEWSNGEVFMGGGSYVGLAAWLAAAEKPRGLIGIVPTVTSCDVDASWIYEDGVFQQGFVANWVVSALVPPDALRAEDSHARLAAAGALADRLDSLHTSSRHELAMELGELAPYVTDWAAHAPGDPYWSARVGDASSVKVPRMIVGGWFDIFLKGTLRSFASSPPTDSRLVIGPWAHGTTSGWFPEHSFGSTASPEAIDITGMQLQWFDSVRTGVAPTSPPVLVFVMGSDEWRGFHSWPPAESTELALLLTAQMALRTRDSPDVLTPGAQDLILTAGSHTPTVGGRTYLPGLLIGVNSGPRNQQVLLDRNDTSVWWGPYSEHAFEVVGPVDVQLWLSGCEDVSISAKLMLDDGHGSVTNLCEGARRVIGLDAVPQQFSIDFGGTAVRVGSGERLGLLVALGDSPRLEIPGPSAVTVHLGGSTPSTLHVTELEQ